MWQEIQIRNMKVREMWLVTVGTNVRTVFVTDQNWYFINDHIVGDLQQITEDEFNQLVKDSKFA